jgi:hypothetical protein
MEGIYETNDQFPFDKLVLTKPTAVAGGNYFIKFRLNDSPVYIQSPKCQMKQGISKAGKRFFTDLMFNNENEQFIQWLEHLENHSQKYIYENRDKWFETDLELHDIETSFSPCLKLYKSGKYYLVRVNIPSILGKCSLKIYDEQEHEIDHESIADSSNIITILEVQGIKCSTRSFQIEMEVKQMLVLKPQNIFDRCILTKSPSANVREDLETTTLFEKEAPEDLETTSPLGKEAPEDLATSIPLQKEAPDDLETSTSFEKEAPEISLIDPAVLYLGEPIEVDFNLDELPENDQIQLKTRNDVYYKMYREAKRKAKIARDLALSSYLDAKRIKNTYMLEEIEDSDSDLEDEEEDFEQSMENV